jgi:hypothetical protein
MFPQTCAYSIRTVLASVIIACSSIRTIKLDWVKREVMEVCAANGIAVEKWSIKP